ncbi:MAG: EFR1 family ferrodoxin [Clostridiaceae bacterium]
MSAIVYYFSGTGNSLIVAKDIATGINADLVTISDREKNERICIDKNIIGIVFPVYHQGIPPIVKRFVCNLEGLSEKYIFGVCTYGDSPGITLEYLDQCIKSKGGRLSAGYAVRMPYNYLTPSFTFKDFFKSFSLREITLEAQQAMFQNWEMKLKTILQEIKSERSAKLETKAKLIEKLVDLFNLRNTLQKKAWLKISGLEGNKDVSFEESIQVMDNGFWYDNNCNGCGTCSKVCPVNNIKIVERRPVWQHCCEQCFACLQWCPMSAIQFREGTLNSKRYHHPNVKLLDILSKYKDGGESG